MHIFGSEPLFWFVLGFIFMILEVATPGIVFVFFGVGAWLVVLLSFLLPLNTTFQVIIFIVTSVLSLFLFRKNLTQILHGRSKKAPTDSLSEPMIAKNYLGQVVEVIKAISPDKPGLVELNGTNWTAQSRESFEIGQRVRVVELIGLTVWVEKLDHEGITAL
jgi:membrane protein implicated in regulation of membrane protease activity